MFESFVSFNFSEGIPSISITKNGLTFSKGVVMKMGYPEYVQLLIDKAGRQIAVKSCSKDEENAALFCSAEKRAKGNVISIRWNQKDLLNTLSNMMEWDLKDDAFRAEGVYYDAENAVLFDLNKAIPLK